MGKKMIDDQEIVNILTKGGHQVRTIEWVGEPEKQKDIFRRLGEAIWEIELTDLSPDEKKRLKNERIQQTTKELEDAGIVTETLPAFGTWPLPPAAGG
jgi:hypothetical protein